ncbi:MAG: hypothetical protein C0475_02085 [Planctomyces sp.]|nr:hypothetical protein [Planctomyces sp.]MBA4038891.1 hypothetical protein [Planctomyces sp.]MBA4119849.1 hypothetical protein [Isosphaera sp.]
MLGFRPNDYWDHSAAIYARIKGERRRWVIDGALRRGCVHELPAETFSETHRGELDGRPPEELLGERLPDLGAGEVEIARVVIRGADPAVISIRADRTRDGQRVTVRAAFERGGVFAGRDPTATLAQCRASRLPSLSELIEIIERSCGAQSLSADAPGTPSEGLDFWRERSLLQLGPAVRLQVHAAAVHARSDYYSGLAAWSALSAQVWSVRKAEEIGLPPPGPSAPGLTERRDDQPHRYC